MTALALKQVVREALAEVGVAFDFTRLPRGKARTTTWLGGQGFGIRHYPSGRNVYIVQARMAGRLRTVTIGPATVLSRHQATTVSRRVIAYAQLGLDAAAERKRIRSAPGFVDFLEEYWTRWSPRWKPSTLDTHNKYRRLYLDRAFPDRTIDGLDEADVASWFSDLNNRLGPGGANRVMTILSSMMNKAEAWGYRLENSNPCKSIRFNRTRRCDRFLSHEELQRVGAVLARVRATDEAVRPIAATAITLMLLTGCRAGEIMDLQWRDVRGNRLKLRDSKTGPRTVWLGDEARALIDGLPRYMRSPWLFWNRNYGRRLKAVDYYWTEFQAEAGLRRVRLHDLRHTFASHAAMSQETLPMIGRLLGHSEIQSTARYAHLDDAHLLDAAEQIGAAIERMLG
ncbi:site-specific integrase [Sphingobium sp. EM0848]|uniref:tyrosine-type recombinase/integrase n=1 Tax=Sphingobium sp. EM0848 TaxID=2743473 RepID=UPI00159C7CDD|nr:site-specific integrase [Sphingobium sp. EM0848]